MRYTISNVELSKEELVSILSTAFDSNDILSVGFANDEDQENAEGTCFEDKLADVLVNGGCIKITDVESDGEIYKGNYTNADVYTFDGWRGAYDVTAYYVSLKDICKGIKKNPNCIRYVNDITEGVGDFWTGFNFIQLALWNELIYG